MSNVSREDFEAYKQYVEQQFLGIKTYMSRNDEKVAKLVNEGEVIESNLKKTEDQFGKLVEAFKELKVNIDQMDTVIQQLRGNRRRPSTSTRCRPR